MSTALRDTVAASKAKRTTRKLAKTATKAATEVEVINPRSWRMFSEALDFKQGTMTPFQRQLADLEIATMDFMEGLTPLLRAPLPRVWETVEGGLAEPIRATVSHGHPHIAGGDVDEPALRASLQDFEARLQLKVRRPLAQWSDAMESVRERFPELERLRSRLERRVAKAKRQAHRVESEQRRGLGLQHGARGLRVRPATRTGLKGMLYRCTHPRADEEMALVGGRPAVSPSSGAGAEGGELASAGGSTAAEGELAAAPAGGGEPVEDSEVLHEFKLEERGMKLKDKQRKLEAASEAFRGEEGLLYEQLSGLCRDTSWTKSYVSAALLMTKELFQEGAFNLGQTLQPLPAIKSLAAAGRGAAAAPAGEEVTTAAEGVLVPPVSGPGQLGSNMAYIVAMPEFATRARARATLEDLKAAATRRLHAHKATAQPLELHASPEARPGERVVPARRGATDRPLSALASPDTPTSPALAGTPFMGVTTPSTPTAAVPVVTPVSRG